MGPLHGVRVVELAGIGPGPFCAMLLGDMGAEVVRIDRVTGAAGALPGPLASVAGRNRRSIAIDLKSVDGRDLALRLIDTADVLIEGYRPGVMERLGLGPDVCRERNPGLVYGRMTGWGQDGPLSQTAGHDIDYIALTGVLHSVGADADRPPVPPLNLVGDYGGGALYLAIGVLAALVERATSGHGDVVDAAMVDGSASLMTIIYQLRGHGMWDDRRAANLLDGGAPYYTTYETADGKAVAVGALEPQFFAELLEGLGIDAGSVPSQYERAGWPELRTRFASVFATKTRDQWTEVFDGTDACVAPVLTMGEAPRHPHLAHRSTFIEVGDGLEPAPAPRFVRSLEDPPRPPVGPGTDTDAVLAELGLDATTIAGLRDAGTVA